MTELQAERGNARSLSRALDYLPQMQPEEACRSLRKLIGVGLKTAACVLMFNLDMPVMPVDARIYRTTVS